jgi:hypothetical protein
MRHLVFVAAYAVFTAGCGSAGSAASATQQVKPVYNKETGRLEELAGDQDGDGKVDTRAFMDGVRVQRIEIDRNRDGKADRWEFYGSGSTAGAPQLERAEESDESGGPITRREYYEGGRRVRVEEDTNGDGRVDKWEYYVAESLDRLELDLEGRGKPTQRLTYGAGGGVSLVESDPDGDGKFEPVKSTAK